MEELSEANDLQVPFDFIDSLYEFGKDCFKEITPDCHKITSTNCWVFTSHSFLLKANLTSFIRFNLNDVEGGKRGILYCVCTIDGKATAEIHTKELKIALRAVDGTWEEKPFADKMLWNDFHLEGFEIFGNPEHTMVGVRIDSKIIA